MPTYVSPFTGTVVTPTDVSYLYLEPEFSYDLYWPSNAPPGQYVLPRILDIFPQVADLYFVLPQANQGATGSDCLITNFGEYDITIYNFTLNQEYVVIPGEAAYFYLATNTTPGGYWEKIDFGSTTSAADANSLAGAGLKARNGLLNVEQEVIDIFADPVFSNDSQALVYNWTSGNFTLPLPAGAVTNSGWFIGFRNSGTGTLTFSPPPPTLINGKTSLDVNPGESGYMVFDFTNKDYLTVGLAPPNNVSFTAATYDVDSIGGNEFSLVTFAPSIQTYVALSGSRTASLLVLLPPITQLYVLRNNTSSDYTINFQVDGSAQSPIITLNNTVSLVLSDGNQLQVISASSTADSFLAINGTAVSPSYSFISDPHTGMYLANPSVLGFSANSTAIFYMDGSNAGAPVTRSLVPFNATLIAGGQF